MASPTVLRADRSGTQKTRVARGRMEGCDTLVCGSADLANVLAGLWSRHVDRRNTAPPAPILPRREPLRLTVVPPVYVDQNEF